MSFRTIAILALALTLAACATSAPPPGTPKVEKLSRPPAGTTWVTAWKNSGSFGTGTGRSTIRYEGERDFQGRK